MDNSSDLYYKTSSPMTFLTWLENRDFISQDYNTNLNDYQEYVSSWHRFNKSTEDKKRESFSSLYIDLLRDITLSYSTEEEKRFISNCDFTKPEELDIVLPFFVQKLKTIILYYCKKRESLKKKLKNITKKGTSSAVSDIIQDIIIEEVESDSLQVQAGTRFNLPTTNAVIENLKIKIEENYDDAVYFNKKSQVEELNVNSDFYINFKNAVITAIKKYPIFLKGIESTFSLNIELSGTEYNLLKKRDFIDYFFSNSTDNLKLLLYRDLSNKFAGCDMYYLSTGSTNTNFITGRLFNTLPVSGNAVLNPINKKYTTFAQAPSITELYTAYECGGFFTPSKVAALEYNTFSKTFTINRQKLKENSVVVFSDPNIIGNGTDSDGLESKNYPLQYEIQVSWNKEQRQEAFKFGDIISEPLYHHFYPYESYSTTVHEDNTGISTPYDASNFWSGEKDTVWTNSDIWPSLKELEKLPIDDRLKSLLVDEGEMVKWFVDIYGNEYGLFKPKTSTIIDKRNTKGQVYVKTIDGVVREFVDVYNLVFAKLPSFVANEIRETINLYIIDSTILIETQNYVILDIIKYDFETNAFVSSFYPGFYRKKYNINAFLEKFIGYTYRPDNNSLYLCFTTLDANLSASNYKSISPLIFKVDLKLKKIITVYPTSDSVVTYSLSTNQTDSPALDIRYVESGHFSFKEKLGLYNLSYLAYNINNTPFIVNEKFYTTPFTEAFTSTNPLLYKPFLYIYDTNFSYHDIKSETGFVSPYTDWAGSYNIDNFKVHQENTGALLYNSPNTTFINQTGSQILNFDWTKYNSYNLNVGCSSFNITYAVDFLLFSKNNKILNIPNQEYILFDFIRDNYVITTFGKIIPNSNLSQMQITTRETFYRDITATNIPPFTRALCDSFIDTPYYGIKKFENSMAVGPIDPIFINRTGTTFLYFDWDQYNSASLYIGCSSFNLNFIEDVLVFSKPTVLMADDNVWYNLINFELQNRQFFAKARVLKNTNRGILEVYTGEILTADSTGNVAPPFSGIFCDTIFSIFKTIEVVKVGDGIGKITSDPSCVICDGRCSFLYPQGSTITLKASAGLESNFTGWLGSDCEGSAGDCLLTVTENASVTAVFNKLPRYDVTIFVNVTGANVTSADSVINCNGIGSCTYSYLGGTPITIQASTPSEGLVFRGFVGGTCDPNSRTCAFYVNSNKSLTALYEPEYSDVLIENVYFKNNIETNLGYFIVGRSVDSADGLINIVGRVPNFQDRASRGAVICAQEQLESPGNLVCSLCRQIPIKYFHIFETDTRTILYVSAQPLQEKYIFNGFLGERCESSISEYCLFNTGTRNITITGLFTPPVYTLSILQSPYKQSRFYLGNVNVSDQYYIDKNTFTCNSYDSNASCIGFYLSGTEVEISAIPESGSFVHLLTATDTLFLSGTNITGLTGLVGRFIITDSTTLSVLSETLQYRTITIYKSSFNDNLFNTVLITPGPSATNSYLIDSTETSATLQYPNNTKLQIFPKNSILGKSSAVIGFSGLTYKYETFDGSGLTLDPNPSEFTQQTTFLSVGDGIILVGTEGPLFENDILLNIEFKDCELYLTQSTTISCIFVPIVY